MFSGLTITVFDARLPRTIQENDSFVNNNWSDRYILETSKIIKQELKFGELLLEYIDEHLAIASLIPQSAIPSKQFSASLVESELMVTRTEYFMSAATLKSRGDIKVLPVKLLKVTFLITKVDVDSFDKAKPDWPRPSITTSLGWCVEPAIVRYVFGSKFWIIKPDVTECVPALSRQVPFDPCRALMQARRLQVAEPATEVAIELLAFAVS